MNKVTLVLTGLLVVGMAVPTAVAHHADDESDANAAGEYYVTVAEDGITIWEETNGHDGLQTSQTTYEPGADGCEGDDRLDRRSGDCVAPADQALEL